MSVIVTGKDVPQTCIGCFLCDWGTCAASKGFCSNKERPTHCPLKSIEGLLDKVEHCIDVMVANDSVMSGAISTRNMIVKIIKDYCEVKE